MTLDDKTSSVILLVRMFYLFLAALLGFAPAPLYSQAPYTISEDVSLVLLDVAVRDKKNAFVSDLGRDNFRVYEDGKPRPIKEFGAMDSPVSIGLIVDNSASMRFKRKDVITAGLAFAKQSNPQDEFFVINFNNQIYFGLPHGMHFTDKLQLLHQALFYGEPFGQTALYDAVSAGLRRLQTAHNDLRTLIVVSDGGDNVSRTTFAELTKQAEASTSTIFTVGLLDPEDHDLNPRVLRRLSSLTGGEYFQPATLRDVVPAFVEISNDIRHRYSIGYKPSGNSTGNQAHTIKVVAERDGHKLKVRTRTSYTVTPDAAAAFTHHN